MQLRQFRLIAERFSVSAAFYKEIMGFPALWLVEEEQYALFDTGDVKLEVVGRGAMAEALGAGADAFASGRFGSALLNIETEDVDAAYVRLLRRGAEPAKEPADRRAWGVRVAYIRDPDGHLIELYRKLPKEEAAE
ncbi:VOC family protein [Paenibacillus sp.]|uniref:VOC family protein n=1 Tax=Paenibacillus sp. TaxID=58172 RepID=UPI002D4307DF|nr:VOC family protein [Paenibacillus sp.]HZG83478.1 VOC family protein [Paenibacillus sp.]